MKKEISLFKKIRRQRRRWEKFSTGLIGICLAIIGIVMLYINYSMENNNRLKGLITVVDDKGQSVEVEYNDTNSTIPNILLYNGGIIFITLGLGSLLLELYGYATYFQKRVSEVFTEKEMLNLLTDEYKQQLKYNVFESLYSPDTKDSKEILALFDNNLAELLSSIYYNSFDLKVELSIQDDKYIVKRFVRTIEICEINTKKKNYYKDIIDIYCEELGDETLVPFELESIAIDGKPTSEYAVIPTSDQTGEEGERYIRHYSCKLNSAIEIHEKVIVEVIYKTIVPITDTTFSFKIDTLCKDFNCIFFDASGDLDLSVVGFNFSPSQKPFIKSSRDTWKSIRSQGWLLPGEGVLCSSIKKH